MSKRVLLVIDLLNDFLNPKGVLYCGDQAREILPVVNSLIDEFHSKNEPIIFLCDAHSPEDKEFELFAPHAVKGSWGAQLVPEVHTPESSLVIGKTRFSGLYGNNLAEILSSIAPTEVWVTGVCTSICVMDTVGDLRNRDFSVVVPENAVADFDMEFHRFALRRMSRIYGTRIIPATV